MVGLVLFELVEEIPEGYGVEPSVVFQIGFFMLVSGQLEISQVQQFIAMRYEYLEIVGPNGVAETFIQFYLEDQYLEFGPDFDAIVTATRHDQVVVGFVIQRVDLAFVVDRVQILPQLDLL